MEEVKKTRRKYSPEEISGILSRYEGSGKNPQEFCGQEGIHPSTLRNWIHGRSGSKKKTGDPSPFVSLNMPALGPLMQVSFPGGRSVNFYAEPRVEFVKELLA